jgi:hypothetical protein
MQTISINSAGWRYEGLAFLSGAATYYSMEKFDGASRTENRAPDRGLPAPCPAIGADTEN